MKNEKFKGFILTVIIIFIVSSIIANNSQLTGNDIVKLGTLETISGKLFEDDEEWFIKADNGVIQLHFGPQEFLESKEVVLEGKKDFSLTGFLFESDMAVVNFVFNDELIELRTEKGEPLWKDSEFSNNRNKTYLVDSKKCIGCQLCVNVCPVKAITMKNGRAVIDADKCINCGICENGDGQNYKGCPVKAISKNY